MSRREEMTDEARCLTDTPIGHAMRQAWAEVFGRPFDAATDAWTQENAAAWPCADRVRAFRFHARWVAIAQAMCGIDPEKPAGNEEVGKLTGGKRLSEATRAAIIADFKAGAGVGELAARHGVHRESVRGLLARRGLAMRDRPTANRIAFQRNVSRRQEVVALHAQGLDGAQIAARTGLTKQRVSQLLRSEGITRPRHNVNRWRIRRLEQRRAA